MLTWKDLLPCSSFYQHLSSVLDSLHIAELSTKHEILTKNPNIGTLKGFIARADPSRYMKRPVVIHNETQFCISSCCDVQICEKGKAARILKGEQGTFLFYLYHNEESLFGFCDNGLLIQWDLKTDTHITIETEYFKQNPSVTLVSLADQATLSGNSQFIFVCYTMAGKIEIIPLNRAPSILLNDNDVQTPKQLIIQNQTLYVFTNTNICTFDLITLQKQRILPLNVIQPYVLRNAGISNNNIYFDGHDSYGIDHSLRILDLLTGQETKKIQLDTSPGTFSKLVGNLFFHLSTHGALRRLAIYNIETAQMLIEIDIITVESGTKELLEFCQNNKHLLKDA